MVLASFAIIIADCSRESSDQSTPTATYEPTEHRHLVRLTPTTSPLHAGMAARFTVSITDTRRPDEAPESLQGAPVHVVIVSRDLRFFEHRHPDRSDAGYQFSATFPRDGDYVAFVYYTIRDENVDISSIPLKVGSKTAAASALTLTPLRSRVAGYEIELRLNPDPPRAGDWTTLSFDARPIARAAPSRGEEPGDHEVIISEGATEFVYAHSTLGEALGGVRGALHLPLGPFTPRSDEVPGQPESFHARFPKPGRYKVWFDTPDAHLATFVIEVREAKPQADVH